MSEQDVTAAPREWECPNGHVQAWANLVSVPAEGPAPVCNACFNEWAAQLFPTREKAPR